MIIVSHYVLVFCAGLVIGLIKGARIERLKLSGKFFEKLLKGERQNDE